MGNRIVGIPGQERQREMQIQAQLAQAAIQRALSDGAAIPVRVVGAELTLPPLAPSLDPVTGKFVPRVFAATLRPEFHGSAYSARSGTHPEDQNTHLFLPTYTILRETGIVLTADQHAFRPFVQHWGQIEVPTGAGVTMAINVPFRSELTVSLFGPGRVLEITRVPYQPWMTLLKSDLEEFRVWIKETLDVVSSDFRQAMIEGLEGEDAYSAIEQLTTQFIAETARLNCAKHGCDQGMVGKGDERGLCGRPECLRMGSASLYSPPESSDSSSTEKSASAAPDEATEASEPEPETSSD